MVSKRSSTRFVVYLALLALAAGRALHAQTGLTGGSLQGSVRDGAGAGLAEALVTLVFEGTGIARTTSTDAEGRYTFPALAVGSYRLRVEAPGFRTWEREGLPAAVGRALVVDVGLVLAASEAVTVHRESTADGNQGAAVAALTEAQAIDGLPANGRNFVAFSLLSPAVVSERTPPTGPTASSGLSFAGQRARANHVMVDGFDNDDAFTGAVAAVFSQEAVREFQVLAASAPAEFGHAAGGTVNTVTKSGSNAWHGSAFFFLRDRALNAKEHFEKVDVFGSPVDAPKGPFHQAQWGATLGGPLRKDRTFAFLSFERRSLDATNFVTIDPGVAASLEAAGFQIALGSVPYAQSTWSALAKVDHTFAPNHRVTLRGHLSDRSDENIEPFGGIVARSHGALQLRRDFGVAVAATDVFSSGWVNEGRLQLVDGAQDIYGLDPACGGPCRDVHQGGPEVTLPGLAVAGRQLNTPQLRGNLDLQLADTLTRSTGRHTLKAGFDLDLIWRDGALSQDFGGRYVFTALRAIPGLVSRPLSALEAFDQGLPALYFQGYGGTTASGTTHLYSVFAQDRFRVRPWLTLEAGLRYQRYALGLAPVTVSDLDGTTLTYEVPDRGDLAPRVSVTVDPSGRGRTTLRASYGLFHEDPLLLTALVTEIVNGRNLRLLRASLPLSAEAWRSPEHRLPEPASPFPSVVQVAGPGLGVGQARQLSVGFTQELGRDLTLSLDALSVRGHGLLGIVDYNPLVPALGAGRRPNDRAGTAGSTSSVNQVLNYGEGWYRGLAVLLRKRFGHGFEALASYTLSEAEDTVSDLVGQVNVMEDPGRGRDPEDPAGAPLGFDPAPV
ncbi:MAG TPA: TonB-dependent receptor, partial [Vicinamibacteria bacterium]